MPLELNSGAMGLELALSGRLSVQQAAQLWSTVQPAIAARDKIRLLAADLDEMDTSIVQILCLLGEQRPERPALLEIAQVSDGFIRSLQRCGLEKFFVRASASPSRVEPMPAPKADSASAFTSQAAPTAMSDLVDEVALEAQLLKERSSSNSTSRSRVNA